MDFDKSIKISVTEPNGRSIRVVVDGGTALLGSGGHCDIRLGPELVAVEQLFFEIQPGGLFAEARANTPHVLLDGVPFQRGRVLEERLFKIGKLEVRAELVDAQGRKRKSEDGVRPGLLIATALVVAMGVYALTHRKGDDGTDYRQAPALFDPQAAVCPDLSPDATTAVVETWLRDASGRHERSPLSPQDGIEAVSLYRRSAACLKRLDRENEADELTNEADSLAERLEKDFHVHRVRLSRALEEDDTQAARHEVKLLRGYLTLRGTDFAEWLDYLDRKLGQQGKT